MRAPGLERDPRAARSGAEELDHLEVRDRLARRVGVEREAGRVVAVAADRRLDPARARRRAPADEGEVGALERALADERGEPFVRLLGARDDEQPRRVAVEAVDDPGPLGLAARDESRRARRRACPRAGRRRDGRRGRRACRRRRGARPPRRSRGVRVGRGGASGSLGGAEARRARRPRAGSSSAAAARRRSRRAPPPARRPPASRGARRGTGRASPPRPRPERPTASGGWPDPGASARRRRAAAAPLSGGRRSRASRRAGSRRRSR